MRIAVAGTGYVGLSLAVLLAGKHEVTAVDIVPEKVEQINKRISPIKDEYIEKYFAEKDLNLCATLNAEEAYINQRVGIIRSDIRKIIYYSLQTPYFTEFVNLNNAGSAQPNISSKAIGEFPILAMPAIEQQAIADYLDEKCANIDSLIQTKQSKIDSLKEYKKSIIYEYVTGKREVE